MPDAITTVPAKSRIIWCTLALTLVVHASAALQAQIGFRQLKREVIESRLQSFSKDDHERAAIVKKLFADSGCTDQLSEQTVRKKMAPNVICVLPGQTDDTIVVGAHTDHVWEGTGVVDNWSGASLLPSLYFSLSNQPRRHTFIFIGFTDEEEGLVGSKYYVSHLSDGERAKIKAMVNMDTLGLGPTKVWASHADKNLLKDLVIVSRAMKVPIAAVNVEQVGSTDSESFAARKTPSITIHSLTQETLSILHSPRDRPDQIHLDDYYSTYILMGGYLAYLDSSLDKTQP